MWGRVVKKMWQGSFPNNLYLKALL
jgi:hypothetical protein